MEYLKKRSILGPLLFLIFFNDITDECVQQNAEIIKYADDTVLFFPAKDLRTIEDNVSDERIATWFEENELIINLKKGKSEVMLFGTSQKLFETEEHPVNLLQRFLHQR